jgi:hypothetical protein
MISLENIEDDISEKLALPYIYFLQENFQQKAMFARYILSLDVETVLLPSCYIFSYPAVLAGLSEIQIEHVAKNAPADYKKELYECVRDDFRIHEAFDIAREMDDDLGQGRTDNQLRLKKILQYINDNSLAFQF